MLAALRSLIDRTRRSIRRYGLREAGRRAAHLAGGQLILSESHVWYALDPEAARPKPSLKPELTLRRGQQADLPLLKQLPTVAPAEGKARLDAGNDLWLVVDGKRPMFSCWIFRDRLPAIAARDGYLALPADTVCLEDSVTAAAARGLGVAPAAWAAIADTLESERKRRIITKVTVENTPSRKAVAKVGFEAVAVMHFRRRLTRSKTWVEPLADDQVTTFLGRALGGVAR